MFGMGISEASVSNTKNEINEAASSLSEISDACYYLSSLSDIVDIIPIHWKTTGSEATIHKLKSITAELDINRIQTAANLVNSSKVDYTKINYTESVN